MKPFKHHNARSIREAASFLSEYGGKAKINAGGTDLLAAMRDKCLPDYPEAVINIKTIDGLNYIRRTAKGLTVGALTKLADVAASPEIRDEYSLLAEAAYSVASPHVRNMATLGGNLAQDVRCWYYRYPAQIGGPIVCLRKGGNLCSALPGDNRHHSLFGAAPLEKYPCSSYCPVQTNIPAYISKVRNREVAEAAAILIEYNPLAAVTGRVCPVFCEPECNRGRFDESVAIQCIERGVGDYLLDHVSTYFRAPERGTGKKIAIVGSGPAGLAAAYYLRRSGHEVRVYERSGEAGGMLRYSIPAYRLPKKVVSTYLDALKGMGIIFELGIEIGTAISLADLEKNHDAVLLAQGTWKSLKLNVPGEGSEGVHYALDYLAAINSGQKVALGRRVVVVGGGSVAMDAARTAKRLGAPEVHVVCLECRELNSKDSMLAQEQEIIEAEEEGVIIHPSLGVQSILAENGRVKSIESVTCISVREPDGSFNPQFDAACAALTFDVDSIIVAIGQTAEVSLGEASTSGRVFTAGDMVTGPSTVIQAVASAREAVSSIEAVLIGQDSRSPAESATESFFTDSLFVETPRVRIHIRPAPERTRDIDVEDVSGLDLEDVEKEANRCFNCGCLAVNPSDVGVALVALNATVVTTKRKMKADRFFTASATCSTVLEPGEIIKEVFIPKPPDGTRQSYSKFTLRTPIDFAVVSVASILNVRNGVCADARIVLGGVAPEPLRARASEELIKGKALSEKVAAEAGKAAVRSAVPLAMNDYKIEITRTLVKRAIFPEQ